MDDLISRSALVDKIDNTDWYHISEQGELVHGASSAHHTPLFKSEDIFSALEEAPAVDAVEVVRCWECKHMKMTGHFRWCTAWERIQTMGDEGFCCFGERKVDK